MKKRRIFLILFSIFLFLSIGLSAKALGNATCNAYCTGGYNGTYYTAGECQSITTCAAYASSIGASGWPFCYGGNCYYTCSTYYGTSPCTGGQTCFCANWVECSGCTTSKCTSSGCSSGCSAATCDLNDYCSGGNLYNYSCNTSSVCAYTGNSCTLACCQAYRGSTASCVSGVCTLPVDTTPPYSVTISASPATVTTGQNITVTISGYDNVDVLQIQAYYQGSWHTQTCDGVQTYCSRSWTFTETTAGTYGYQGYIYDTSNNGAWASPNPVYVTVNAACACTQGSLASNNCTSCNYRTPYYYNCNCSTYAGSASYDTSCSSLCSANGSSCTLANQCASGYCVDGRCCNSLCNGLCQECNILFQEGTCSYTNSGYDLANECAAGTCRTGYCAGGSATCGWPSDDGNCGSISCSAYNTYYSSSKNCYYRTYNPLTSNRCASLGTCKVANTTNCTSYGDSLTASCSVCQTLSGCSGSTAGTCSNIANGTSCGTGMICTNGSCVSLLPNGSSCTLASQCSSGYCVDGYCCNQACGGSCMECNVNLYYGSCRYTYDGWDPINECVAGTCRTGNCNGGGACGFPSDDGNCGSISCSAYNTYYSSSKNCYYRTYNPLTSNRCASLGTCKVANTTNCTSYGDSLTASCDVNCQTLSGCSGSTAGTCSNVTNGTSCGTGKICTNGSCVSLLPNGSSCTLASQCSSGYCVDGRCCNSLCNGLCQECNILFQEGTCSYTNSGYDLANECVAGLCKTGNCNGGGACGFPSDDGNCGSISCSAYNTYYSSSKNCYYRTYNPLTSNRCSSLGVCKVANTTNCNSYGDSQTVSCNADCQTLSGCTGSTAGTCVNIANGTTCQTNKICSNGSCVDKKSNGSTCTGAIECTSGYCVDGRCCNSLCNGLCQECNILFQEGTCSYTNSGYDLANECVAGTCRTGYCAGGSATCGWPADDSACTNVYCGGNNIYWSSAKNCYYRTFSDITSNRCASLGTCKSSSYCISYSDSQTVSCNADCQTLSGCTGSTAGTCVNIANGTTCQTNKICSNGSCVDKKSNGSTCTGAIECTSGYCVDGRCCNSLCNGLCQECNILFQEGTCSYTNSGYDLANECVAGTCRTGYCAGGSATCGWPADDSACVVNCSGLNNYSQVGQSCIYHTYSNLTSNRCESLGACKVANTTNCGTPSDSTQITCGECKTVSGCNLTTPGSCITAPNGTSCGTGSTCQDGVCRKSNGSTCTVGTECISNSCSDGVCCNSSCSGTCQKCSLSGSVGTCTYISNGEDPDNECSGMNSCNGSGGCTTCSVLNPLTAPTDRWQRVWRIHSTGACLGNGPDETALQINQIWADGVVIAYGRSTDIEMQSVRTINIQTAGTYRFGLGSDDGVALSIDNGSTLIFDKWSDHTWPGSPEYMDAYLSAGNHTFELNYYNNGGGGQLTFVYSLLFPVCSRTSPVKSGNNWTITSDCWKHGNACYNDVDGVCDETCETKLAEGEEIAENTITIPQGLWDTTVTMSNISGLAKCLGDACLFNNDCSARLMGAGFTLYLDGEWLEEKQNDMNIIATGDGIQESSGNGNSVSSVKQINCAKVGGCSLKIEKRFTSMVWTSNSMFGGDKPAYGYVQLKADISVSLSGITDLLDPTAEIIAPPQKVPLKNNFYTNGSYLTKFRFSDSGGSGLKYCDYEIRNRSNIIRSRTPISSSECKGDGPVEFISPNLIEPMTVGYSTSNTCRLQGTSTCMIILYAEDNAGNKITSYQPYGIDFDPPTTEIK